jgi:hypothetical protein
MSQYTKGPWYVEDADAAVPVCAESDGMLVAYVDYTKVRRDPVEYAANAQLIAAAPEMAEMLLSMFSHVSHGGPTRAEAEALLKKAGLR